MRTISGRGGSIYVLGEPFRFVVPMHDCGTGWDWETPGVCCWEPETLSFQTWRGEWEDLEPLEVHPRSGRVSFARCLTGESVKATGTGCPASLIAASEWWRLELSVVVANRSVLGSGDVATAMKTVSSNAFAKGVTVSGPVFVEFPFGNIGVFTGCGNALPGHLGSEITFDQEGVLYEPA